MIKANGFCLSTHGFPNVQTKIRTEQCELCKCVNWHRQEDVGTQRFNVICNRFTGETGEFVILVPTEIDMLIKSRKPAPAVPRFAVTV